jgi:hypothetical protein
VTRHALVRTAKRWVAALGRWSVFGDGGRWIGVTAVLVLTTSGAVDRVLLLRPPH